jgi:hypothetical protein
MMASPQSTRNNQTEKRRRGKLGLTYRTDKVAVISAKVLVILEINDKYYIVWVRKGRLGAAGSEERWERRFRCTMVQRNPQTRGEATGGASKRAESVVSPPQGVPPSLSLYSL